MVATLTRPNYARVKREVENLHRRFSVEDPPVNPVEMSRLLNVPVNFVTFSGDSDSISGFFDALEHSIYVNAREFPLRQNFTVAHELGHALLHLEWAKSSDYQMLMRDQEAAENNPFEKEANAFAAHLLVPRFLLDRFFPMLNARDLSRLFAVSVPVIENRLSFEYGVR